MNFTNWYIKLIFNVVMIGTIVGMMILATQVLYRAKDTVTPEISDALAAFGVAGFAAGLSCWIAYDAINFGGKKIRRLLKRRRERQQRDESDLHVF